MAKTGGVERIDTSAFDAAISEIENAKKAFEKAKKTFESAARVALEGWSGYGKDAFNDSYKQLSRALRDEEDNLTAFSKELKTIESSYEKWDSSMAKKIKSGTSKASSSSFTGNGSGGGGGSSWSGGR